MPRSRVDPPEGDWPLEIDVEIHTFEIDFAGHVSNIVYIQWLEIARTALLEAVDLPIARITGEGFAPIVARTEIEYRRPLRLGDPVVVALAITKMRSLSAFMEFEIRSGDEVAATARQLGLFVSIETGKPRRLTPELRSRFDPFIVTGD